MKELNPIKLARLRKGITQAELAEMVGVSVGSISMWETGITHPTPRRYNPLAKALGVSVDELLTG